MGVLENCLEIDRASCVPQISGEEKEESAVGQFL